MVEAAIHKPPWAATTFVVQQTQQTIRSVGLSYMQYISHHEQRHMVVQETQQTIGSVGLSYSTLSEQESKQVPPIHFQTILKSTH